MTNTLAIKRALERNIKAVSLRPTAAHGTEVTRATITDGCTCEITDGPWKLFSDLPKSEGGANQGPTPGVLGRGALASCLAMTIVVRAAEKGVPLDAVAVEVQADWDAHGYLGLGEGIPPGYTQLRVVVEITSSESEERIREVVAIAERVSSYVDVFRRSNDMRIELTVTHPKAA
jgi:uncharacterized OsmC-like protein